MISAALSRYSLSTFARIPQISRDNSQNKFNHAWQYVKWKGIGRVYNYYECALSAIYLVKDQMLLPRDNKKFFSLSQKRPYHLRALYFEHKFTRTSRATGSGLQTQSSELASTNTLPSDRHCTNMRAKPYGRFRRGARGKGPLILD